MCIILYSMFEYHISIQQLLEEYLCNTGPANGCELRLSHLVQEAEDIPFGP